MQPQQFQIHTSFPLENGGQLPHPTIAYHTYGDPAHPVVWVCHPFHTDSDVFQWWPGLFGAQGYFHSDKYFIVCANVLGSCFGSTGPLSENAAQGGSAFFHEFPVLTIRDIANAHDLLRKHLKINKIHLLIGASTGGQQALEWAIQQADIFENLVLIATNARQSPWVIALNTAGRLAIEADITWRKNHPQAGAAGMRAAAAIGILLNKSYQTYDQLRSEPGETPGAFPAAIYQQEHSEKRVKELNAFSFYNLLESSDTHDVGRGRGSIAAALSDVRARTLVLGISSDQLCPNAEQRFLSEKIPGAIYREIHSEAGHEAYLTETSRLKHLLQIFLERVSDTPSAPVISGFSPS